MAIISEFLTGSLTREQVLAVGHDDTDIARAIKAGELVRLGRGRYLRCGSTHRDHEDLHRERAMARVRGSTISMVSHVSALTIHGLPVDGTDLARLHTTIARGSGGFWRPGHTQHTAVIQADDVFLVDGVRVTSPARTLVDVGRTESFRTTVVATDHALRTGIVTGADLKRKLLDLSRFAGIGAARRAISFADGRSESVGESRLRIAARRLGFPPPDLQVEIRDRDGRFLGRADLGYPEAAVVVEFDGVAKYVRHLGPGETAADVVVREKVREDAIRAAGFHVARFTWRDLDHPDALAARLARAIELGRRHVAGGLVDGSAMPKVRIGLVS